MRVTTTALLGILLPCLCLNALACEPSQRVYGCKINGGKCVCYYGCRTEDMFRNSKECQVALAETARGSNTSNVCNRRPCGRGICAQTAVAPGFTCKCEGTGYYGHFCEKACRLSNGSGQNIPHVCIII